MGGAILRFSQFKPSMALCLAQPLTCVNRKEPVWSGQWIQLQV